MTAPTFNRPRTIADAVHELDRTIVDLAEAEARLDTTMQQLKDATAVASSLAVTQAMWHADRDLWMERCAERDETIADLRTTVEGLGIENTALQQAAEWLAR